MYVSEMFLFSDISSISEQEEPPSATVAPATSVPSVSSSLPISVGECPGITGQAVWAHWSSHPVDHTPVDSGRAVYPSPSFPGDDETKDRLLYKSMCSKTLAVQGKVTQIYHI